MFCFIVNKRPLGGIGDFHVFCDCVFQKCNSNNSYFPLFINETQEIEMESL